MTSKAVLINVEEHFKSIASKFSYHPHYQKIASIVSQEIDKKFSNYDNSLYELIYMLSALLFGLPKDIWTLVKYEIIGIPPTGSKKTEYTPYRRGANQPVLHCPYCGSPGKPNGYTRKFKHQYVCSACGKTFTENSALEKEIVQYLILIRALEMFRHSISKSGIHKLLGVSRWELKRFLRGIYQKNPQAKMNKKILRVIKSIMSRGKYVLVAVDTTFFGRTAVILIKVNHGGASMYLADKESTKSVAKALEFLKSLGPEYQDRLVFLQDGSSRIYNAIRENFGNATVIRQFHNEEALGLVHVHFTYNSNRYTLVLRWDYFVEDSETMYEERGLTGGEAVLEKDELVLYAGIVVNPNHLLAEELERRINWVIGFGTRMDELPALIENDYAMYAAGKRSRIISMVAQSIRIFQKYKKHVIEHDSKRCKSINEAIHTGIKKMQHMDFSVYDGRFLLKLYRGIKVLSLCAPSREEQKQFVYDKNIVLRAMERELRESPVWARELDKKTVTHKKKVARSRYSRVELYRGRYSRSDASEHPEIEYILGILRKFFGGKYITTNIVEGLFGRVKSSVKVLRNVGNAEEEVAFRFGAVELESTNPFSAVLVMLDLLPFGEYLRIKSEMRAEAGVRQSGSRKLEVGHVYLVQYRNRLGERKMHLILVRGRKGRRNTVRDTYYKVAYLTTEGLREGEAKVAREGITLRGDRIEAAVEIELRVIH